LQNVPQILKSTCSIDKVSPITMAQTAWLKNSGKYRITGIIRKRKCLRIVNSRENICEWLLINSFLVQLPISPLALPIFPTKVATVEALQSSMRQCSSYSGHTHLQLLNCVIFSKHSYTEVEYSAQA